MTVTQTQAAPPPVRAVILDFDGTFTDVDAEAAPFVTRYRDHIRDLLGRDLDDDWSRLSAEIDAHPEAWGWQNGGVIVAPGNADPYVRVTTIAQALCDHEGKLRDRELRGTVLSAIYQHAYRHTITAFRPDARATLAALLATSLPVFVITNARTDVVERKLAELAPPGLERLRLVGDAGKYVVCEPQRADERWLALPRERFVDGLPRAMAPRRGRYYDALCRVFAESGASPAETLVCGDIFELDLLLPMELGLQLHLLSGAQTPAYERALIAALGARAAASDRLGDLLARVGLPPPPR